jgi:hypothetical protein
MPGPLSELGLGLLPASREPVKEGRRSAEILEFAPSGYPLKIRVVSPPDLKPPDPEVA